MNLTASPRTKDSTMKIRFMFAATLLLLPALQLQAQTLDCDNAMTQMEINQCAAQALEQADQELNRVYTQYRAGLQAKDWQALKQVQLAWIKFRDLDCKQVASIYEGGSMQPMVRSNCLAERTRERISHLEQMTERLN